MDPFYLRQTTVKDEAWKETGLKAIFVLDTTSVQLKVITEKEFIEQYGEKVQTILGNILKYRYEPNCKDIMVWEDMNDITSYKENISCEEAHAELLQLTKLYVDSLTGIYYSSSAEEMKGLIKKIVETFDPSKDCERMKKYYYLLTTF